MDRRLRILASDDDEGIRSFLFSLLTEHGHEVEFAKDSDDVFKNLGRARYDLLILDVNTPGMNGYKVAEKVTNNITNRPRILIFTARDIKAEELQFVTSGADAVIGKGAGCADIIKTIDGLFTCAMQAAPPANEKKETLGMTEQACRTEEAGKKISQELEHCIAKITRVEDDINLKNLRYEEFIRELLREKQRTEKNYLEFKRIEAEVSRLRNWGYAAAAAAGLAVLRSFF